MNISNHTSLSDLNIISEISPCTSGTIEEMHNEDARFVLGRLYSSSAAFHHNTHDWALFSIDERDHWKPNTINSPAGVRSDSNGVTHITSKYDHLKDDEILAVTSSCGMLKGRLYGTAYYLRIGGSKSFQETWTVNLETQVGQSILGLYLRELCFRLTATLSRWGLWFVDYRPKRTRMVRPHCRSTA